ncbi:MAG: XTP/dITP diphosphatase [Sandaracinaceae bacterium]|nr:XTP/dITP diphosphatase [Sandaracinaceae bacterium]
MRVLVATRNAGKVRELARLFAELPGVELVGLDAFDELPDVVEDGATFEDNAAKKARELARASRLPTLADDSGLEVDALGGAPGVRSARYAGAHGDDAANNARVLSELEGVSFEARTARFVCVLAFADPAGPLGEHVLLARGTIEGRLLEAPRGEGGFGYDPLFLPLGETRTTAEMPAAEKNAISHRGEASRAMRELLAAYLARRELPYDFAD